MCISEPRNSELMLTSKLKCGNGRRMHALVNKFIRELHFWKFQLWPVWARNGCGLSEWDVTVQKFNTQIFRADYSRDEDDEENTGERVTLLQMARIGRHSEFGYGTGNDWHKSKVEPERIYRMEPIKIWYDKAFSKAAISKMFKDKEHQHKVTATETSLYVLSMKTIEVPEYLDLENALWVWFAETKLLESMLPYMRLAQDEGTTTQQN